MPVKYSKHWKIDFMTFKEWFEENSSIYLIQFQKKNSRISSPDFAMSLVCLQPIKALEQRLSMLSSGLLPPIFSVQVLRVKPLGFYTHIDTCNCNAPLLCLRHWLRYINAEKRTNKISLSQWTSWHKKES